MPVHFVYRCPYANASGRHIVHFPDDTVLDWFRRQWAQLCVPDSEEANDRLEKLLGINVYGFSSLFERAAENDLPAPTSNARLRDYMDQHLYVEGEAHCQPHAIQALTDDDDLGLAYFIFDDHFRAKHADRVAFLLNEGWQLPGGAGEGVFRPIVKTERLPRARKGEGTVYMMLLGIYSTDYLECQHSYRLDGIRLPELARFLATSKPRSEWPFELLLVRSQLLAEQEKLAPQEKAFLDEIGSNPGDETTWGVYSDWLADQGRPCAGTTILGRALRRTMTLPIRGVNYNEECREALMLADKQAARAVIDRFLKKERAAKDSELAHVHAEQHLAQACPHIDENEWHQWVFFDDRWAAAHPALANGLLAYGLRWDALSSWKSPPPD